ncbi:hypothetical protein BY996DRAFT_6530036 [Phakopsora pachyrhizi]|nr:hypothetical protein BY996DRAFT_6530036 [Phakopsora pachyrhizi]
MPPGKGRRARWKAGKERHSKATECHASAIQAQGKYEKDKSLNFFSGDSEHNEDEEEEEEEEDIDANECCGGRFGGLRRILQDFEEKGVAVEENGWRHWKEEQKLGGGAHQGQSGWSKTTGAADL